MIVKLEINAAKSDSTWPSLDQATWWQRQLVSILEQVTALRQCLLICHSLLSALHLRCKQGKQPPGLGCAQQCVYVCWQACWDGNKAIRLHEDRVAVCKNPQWEHLHMHSEQVKSTKGKHAYSAWNYNHHHPKCYHRASHVWVQDHMCRSAEPFLSLTDIRHILFKKKIRIKHSQERFLTALSASHSRLIYLDFTWRRAPLMVFYRNQP